MKRSSKKRSKFSARSAAVTSLLVFFELITVFFVLGVNIQLPVLLDARIDVNHLTSIYINRGLK